MIRPDILSRVFWYYSAIGNQTRTRRRVWNTKILYLRK
jgi:hypothetical protein